MINFVKHVNNINLRSHQPYVLMVMDSTSFLIYLNEEDCLLFLNICSIPWTLLILHKYVYFPLSFSFYFAKSNMANLEERCNAENECIDSAQLGLEAHPSIQRLMVIWRLFSSPFFHPCLCPILMISVTSEDRLLSTIRICKPFLVKLSILSALNES